MSNNKISGIHAIGVEVPEDMSLKELMEQLLNDTEVELEKDLDGETRKPEPQSEADKWQRYADMLGDLFDVAHQIGYGAYMQGDLKIMRKVLQVESDVVDLAGIVTTEKSRAANEHRSVTQKAAYASSEATVHGRPEVGRVIGPHVP